jgi:GGDEF domain-containing protein
MDYMKHLLNKEKIKLPQQQATYAELYEMLGNQQEFKNVIKKALSTIKGLKGNVTLAQYTEGRFVITGFLGDKEFVETTFEDKEALKKVSTTKSPYFSEFEEVKFENQYIVLPILAKDEFLGALCIHDEQDVKVWDEVHLFIHFIAVVFKYYNLIDLNKDIDIKDVVTGLFNYRHFNDQLDIETEKSRRYHAPLSVLLLDVQNFKLINDRLGYDAGDDVLKQIANWLKKNMSPRGHASTSRC